MNKPPDPFDLQRFISAQEGIYEQALAELQRGQKRSHWIWFIFPQIEGLGSSQMTRYYAIKSMDEAIGYLSHPLLGRRLRECAQVVLSLEGLTISEIFGYPDDLKMKSSMTLFAQVAEPGSVFAQILYKYYKGQRDNRTIELLEKLDPKGK